MHDVYLTAGGFDSPTVQLPVGGAIVNGIVNAATNLEDAAVAPGSIVSISGTSLAGSDASGSLSGYATAGRRPIRMGGIASPLYDVSATFGQWRTR